jgi:hypothetical protein
MGKHLGGHKGIHFLTLNSYVETSIPRTCNDDPRRSMY